MELSAPTRFSLATMAQADLVFACGGVDVREASEARGRGAAAGHGGGGDGHARRGRFGRPPREDRREERWDERREEPSRGAADGH